MDGEGWSQLSEEGGSWGSSPLPGQWKAGAAQHCPWISTNGLTRGSPWFPVIKHIIKINTDPSYNRTIYSDMAIKNDHITITLTAGWPLDTNKALGGDSDSRYLYGAFRVTGATDIRTDNDCGSTIDPDRTLISRPRYHHGPGGKQVIHIIQYVITFASSDLSFSKRHEPLCLSLPYPTIDFLSIMVPECQVILWFPFLTQSKWHICPHTSGILDRVTWRAKINHHRLEVDSSPCLPGKSLPMVSC